jgi:hypothetical protein
MVNIMIGESAGKRLSKVPLSNNTINRRMQHIAEDLSDQWTEKLKGMEFGLQLDEATGNNNYAPLICNEWFIDGSNNVENLLFCKSITASAKAQDLFKILDTLISETVFSGLSALVSVPMVLVLCPAVMEDCKLLFEAKPLKHCGSTAVFTWMHSRQNTLNQVLEYVVNVVNFIKILPLKARFFKNYVRIWDLTTCLCYTTALLDGFLVVTYCPVRFNCDKKFIFFLKRRNTNIPNILWMKIFW